MLTYVRSILLLLAIATVAAANADAQRQRYSPDLFSASGPTIPELDVAAALDAGLRDSIVKLARAQIGKRYRYGAESGVRGFDCSGLIRFIFSRLDRELPRTAALQARAGEALPPDTTELRPGDLLFFGRGSRVTHIGVYVGEGRFIHASSVAGRVIESRVFRPPHPRIAPLKGARRLSLVSELASEPVYRGT